MLAFMRYVYIYCVYIYTYTYYIIYISISLPSTTVPSSAGWVSLTHMAWLLRCGPSAPRHSPHASSWANPSGLWSLGGLGAWDKKHDRQQIPVLLSCSLKRQNAFCRFSASPQLCTSEEFAFCKDPKVQTGELSCVVWNAFRFSFTQRTLSQRIRAARYLRLGTDESEIRRSGRRILRSSSFVFQLFST